MVAPKTGVPLILRDLPEGSGGEVLIQDFDFVAPDAADGESSIALAAARATSVDLDHVALIAGRGGDARPATAARVHTVPAENGMPGSNAPRGDQINGSSCTITGTNACSQLLRSIPQAWTCPAGSDCSTPCETDNGVVKSVNRRYGSDGGNGFRAPQVQAGSVGLATIPADAGQPGSTGKPGGGFGGLTDEGLYLPSNSGAIGQFGRIGAVGQGGKGAGPEGVVGSGDTAYLSPQIGGAGGSGGKPGCGGFPGSGGAAGGASIGLISFESVVRLLRVSIVTAEGGDGGAPTVGTAGQKGSKGGKGGTSTLTYPAGADGQGGKPGGYGGPGGPGGGGPSIGILVSGPEPERRAMTFQTGAGGKGANALPDSGVGSGADGLSQDLHVIEAAVE